MKRLGPLLTLAAGVVVAAVLMVLNLNATNVSNQSEAAGAADPQSASAPGTVASGTVAPSTAAPTTSAPVVPAGPPVTYAGTVGGGGASIAIAVKDGTAVAYLCDGATAEAWLQGTASGGQLSLTGDNARLSGTYANGVAEGTVTAAGRDWSFSVGTVQAPSGLYRAATQVTGATVVGGWIVLPDGSQVGTQHEGDAISPAPRLNLPSQTSMLGGKAVTATVIDGTSLEGTVR